jgi:4-hydroxybenzoate polyprenyltransferase
MATALPVSTSESKEPPRDRAGVLASLPLALADIKLAHSVFALPFAILAAFLATPLFHPPTPSPSHRLTVSPSQHLSPPTTFLLQLSLVILCMVLARTFAMLVNRLADRRFDAANPRTSQRPLASGSLPLRAAVALTSASAALFIGAAALFWPLASNPWPFLLSIPVLAWIALYSFTKRFTALCHIFLGGALAASPIAAAIAIDPGALATTPAIWWLAGMVLCWVAGFDVIYALQDIDFDRAAGLHSVPARIGWRGALWVSRGLHACALGALLAAWLVESRFGPTFLLGIGAVVGLLFVEHWILVRRGRSGLEVAFFTVNGIVSCLLGIAGVADVLT